MTGLLVAPHAPGWFQAAIVVGFFLLSAALVLGFIRLVVGPNLPDRAVALELIASIAVGFIALACVATEQPILLDVAIGVALIAFLGAVALARYLEKRAPRT